MQERMDLKNKISYVGNKSLPLLRLFRYKEAFSLAFVQHMIEELKLTDSDLILDPFCGMARSPDQLVRSSPDLDGRD